MFVGVFFVVDIMGVGFSFINLVLFKWVEGYKVVISNIVNYQFVGLGVGIKQLFVKIVIFGVIDKLMSDGDFEKNGFVQFLMIFGGIVVIYNIEGVKLGEFVFDGEMFFGIFFGKIIKWDDVVFKKLNFDVKLFFMLIFVVYCVDGLGMIFNFMNYFLKVLLEWKEKVGLDMVVQWLVGFGVKGFEGVFMMVVQIVGLIFYVEYFYVVVNKMGFLKMKNVVGKVVELKFEIFVVVVVNVDWKGVKNFNVIVINQLGDVIWLIVVLIWVVFYKQLVDKVLNDGVFDFFKWVYEKGQKDVIVFNYVVILDFVFKVVMEFWKKDFGMK